MGKFKIVAHCVLVTVVVFQLVQYLRVGHSHCRSRKDVKNILLWPQQIRQVMNFNMEMFNEFNCSKGFKCVYTTNTKLLPIEQFDAIVFPLSNLELEMPVKRSPGQFYIAGLFRPPDQIGEQYLRFPENFFNWTMSYRLDSDIIISPRKFKTLKTGEIVSPSMFIKWAKRDEIFYDRELMKIAVGKKKKVLWITGSTPNKHEKLINQLRQFIEIDVTKYFSNVNLTDYWFFVAPEKSFCRDYVSSLFYSYLTRHSIPIVVGPQNFEFFLPPRSFINLRDFETLREFVDYLNYLIRNPRQYIKYFWWEKHYELNDDIKSVEIMSCDLCQKIYEASGNERQRKTYKDIANWWHYAACEETVLEYADGDLNVQKPESHKLPELHSNSENIDNGYSNDYYDADNYYYAYTNPDGYYDDNYTYPY